MISPCLGSGLPSFFFFSYYFKESEGALKVDNFAGGEEWNLMVDDPLSSYLDLK